MPAMKPRPWFLWLRFVLPLFIIATTASAQDPARLQTLWDGVTKHWSDGDLTSAETAAGELIEALKPKATDFSLGIQLNSAYHNRASIRFMAGSYAGAEADLLESLAQAAAIQPPAGLPPQVAPQMMAMVDDRKRLCLRALTNFYLASGDQERATQRFREALALRPLWEQQGGDNPAMAYQILASEISSMEGSFYRQTGDYANAMEAFLKRVNELEAAWGKVQAMFGTAGGAMTDQLKMNYLRGKANCLMELAEIASLLEKHQEAVGFCNQAREAAVEMLPLYEQWAKTTLQTNPAMPKETIETTLRGVRTNTGYLVCERSAQVLRAAGEEKAALALVSEGLKERGGDFKQQRFLSLEYNLIRPEESLTLLGDLSSIVGSHAEADAAYQRALELTAGQYPAGHPGHLAIRESLALLRRLEGRADEAKAIATEVLAGRLANLEQVLAFADEAQRLSYRNSIDPWSLPASLGLTAELSDTVFRTKGIVLDSLLEDRALLRPGADEETRQAYAALEAARRRLTETLLGGAASGGQEVTGLRKTIESLEAKLSPGGVKPRGSRKALATTTAEVAAAIPAGAVLVEFIRYRDYAAPGRFVTRYGALVLPAGGQPTWVPVEKAAVIDAGLNVYAEAVRSAAPDEDMRKLLRGLHTVIWAPVQAVLPEGARLILAPDGALNFLSFATLLDADDRFLAERHALSYVTTGRDLLPGPGAERQQTIEMLANPDFQTPSGSQKPSDSRSAGAALSMRGTLDRIGLAPLPGTKVEAEQLSRIVTQQWGWRLRTHVEKEAQEAVVNGLASPGVLHLASHGFFLPATGRVDPLQRAARYWDPTRAPARGQEAAVMTDIVLDNPMHRSGIALAGAEATLGLWGGGQIPDTANDGILTAGEMAGLNLSGTWLVVLSACETGLGEARSGEGVLGMRRGLMQAGARNLLLTLWPVADAETVLYMVDFYGGLDKASADPATVAHAMQVKYLTRFRAERGLTAAVQLAGPFILSFRH